MKSITRNTAVISVSLPKEIVRKLEEARRRQGQSRSAFIQALINKEAEKRDWEEIYELGRQTAKRMNITSEDDIDRILHED
ncbi:MAG: ribbon-helix-helix protein, CopG family [bacterium]|nr:ribbon-helix-helix protein, CopG family [bacterium]